MVFQIDTSLRYDKTVKVDGIKMRVLSKDQLETYYPNATIIGDAGKKKCKPGRKAKSELQIADEALAVGRLNSYSKAFYKVKGYVGIGGDQFLAVKKSRIPFLLILLLGLALICCIGFVLYPTIIALVSPSSSSGPDNPLPSIDPDASIISSESQESKNPHTEGGGNVTMTYTLKAYLHLSTGKIDMMFQNPYRSTHDVGVNLYLTTGGEDILIASSGRLQPGMMLSSLTFDPSAVILREGMYTGRYGVVYYDENTGERSVVEANITDVELKVTEN